MYPMTLDRESTWLSHPSDVLRWWDVVQLIPTRFRYYALGSARFSFAPEVLDVNVPICEGPEGGDITWKQIGNERLT